MVRAPAFAEARVLFLHSNAKRILQMFFDLFVMIYPKNAANPREAIDTQHFFTVNI